jgi:hypothetical protein
LETNHNPRNGLAHFNTSLFAPNAPGRACDGNFAHSAWSVA